MAMKRTFDRRVQFDERSRAFPIRELVASKSPRSYTWGCQTWLDQGVDGACVGFAWGHEMAAQPAEWPFTNQQAKQLYLRAQQLDNFPGVDYSGTSVLAGAKASVEAKWVGAYRWAFNINDLILAVGYEGPVILGINWHNDMMDPDRQGFVRPTGGVAGGHAILCRAVNVDQGHFRLRNSWGRGWGLDGDCRIKIADMATLLADDGEACVPERRRAVT